VIEAAGGRCFFLCTTIRAVNRVAERLRDEFAEARPGLPAVRAGRTGRTELLDSFRKAGNAVLVGSQSFWEGVDVRGEALSLVIIDKLPFAPPDDPVLAARIEVMEKKGMNGFMHHTLPEAIINLKQGAGRLIRDEDDRGVLMLCDPRVISKPYGGGSGRVCRPSSARACRLKCLNSLKIRIQVSNFYCHQGKITTFPVTLRAAMSLSACAVSASAYRPEICGRILPSCHPPHQLAHRRQFAFGSRRTNSPQNTPINDAPLSKVRFQRQFGDLAVGEADHQIPSAPGDRAEGRLAYSPPTGS
jgi:hypothetical protein